MQKYLARQNGVCPRNDKKPAIASLCRRWNSLKRS